jgi:hypothetical protein
MNMTIYIGEEPLPKEDPSNPAFKPIIDPSRLESYLITNQFSNYCDQIKGYSLAVSELNLCWGANSPKTSDEIGSQKNLQKVNTVAFIEHFVSGLERSSCTKEYSSKISYVPLSSTSHLCFNGMLWIVLQNTFR